MEAWANLLANQTFPGIVAILLLIAGMRQYRTLGRRVSALEKANAELLTRYATDAARVAERANRALEQVAQAFDNFTATLAHTHPGRFPFNTIPPPFIEHQEDELG
jgi:hypothetical protein